MNETFQNILVAIIILAAIVWIVNRLFFTHSCSCGCGEKSGCEECCKDGQCGDCPLMNNCKKNSKS